MHEQQSATTELRWDLIFSFKKLISLFVFLAFSTSVFALDIDEKLTLRILKTSISKKTILINRGLEDGLVIGDHAKFFLTDGVIARGLVIKASPSRSVWSLYRIIRINEIADQRVVNLKIATPVKVTTDPTRSFNASPIISGREIMVERSNGEIDLGSKDKQDLAAVNGRYVQEHKQYNTKVDTKKSWELVGFAGTQSLTASSSTGSTEVSTETTVSSTIMGAGIEKYFPTMESSFARKFSFLTFFNRNSNSADATGASASIVSMDFGIGSFYHFLNLPFAINKFILFAGGTMGLGKQSLTTETPSLSVTVSGTSNFFSAMGGVKYLMNSGLGFRAFGEFVKRGVTYKAETAGTVDSTESQTGFRFYAGIAYRW